MITKNLRILLIVGLILGATFLIWPKSALTVERQLERHGFCDVIYYNPDESSKSHFLGSTPIVGIGVIWYQTAPIMALGEAGPELIGWFGDVIKVAVAEKTEWRLIEIEVLYQIGSELKLGGSIVITRRSPRDSNRTLENVVAEGGLTTEEFRSMLESGQIQVVVNSWGWEYGRGVNCERMCPIE